MQSEIINKKLGKKAVWLLGIMPLLLLAGLISVIASWGTGVEEQQAAPIEVLNFERIILTDDGFEVRILNSGPKELTVAQVVVDDSFGMLPTHLVLRLRDSAARRSIFLILGWREILIKLSLSPLTD